MDANIIAAWAGASGAGIAAAALIYSVWDSKRKTTFEHLRVLDERLQKLWHHDADGMKADVLEFYEKKADSLSDRAAHFLGFVNALELIAYGRATGAVSAILVDGHLMSLFRSGVIDREFLYQFQQCCGDQAVYEPLYNYLCEIDDRLRRLQP